MNPAQSRRAINPWIVTIAVMLATFMEILDTTVVNVSIPHLAGNMGATVEEGTWVVTSYLVSNAIILPMSGWLANRFGRRRILLTCVTGFTLTSLLCGMATSLDWLIFGKNWCDGWPGLLISAGLGLAGAIGQLLIFYRPPVKTAG